MALGFHNTGIFAKPKMQQPAMAAPQTMSPNVAPLMAEPKKPGMNWLGIAADFLSGMAGGQANFAQYSAQQRELARVAQERQQMAVQKRMQDREDKEWEWQNKPKDQPNPTEFERILAASGLPPEQQIQLMQDYARNRANPVQGVPYTDAQGNSGIQFIRPGQMQGGQTAPSAPVGKLTPLGGSGGNVTGGFR